MTLLTFSPGPSKLSNETKQDIHDALDLGIPEISHRSKAFTDVSRTAVEGLRTLFEIPEDYLVFYTSSATEAMELTIRSTVERTSFHFTNGNFSEYFQKISQALGKNALADKVQWGHQNDYEQAQIPEEAELITITQNETSTGVMCDMADIRAVRERCPHSFLAVDSTSIAGLTWVDIAAADVWLFSVQKCFGLPAGLGVMIVSPHVVERAIALADVNPYGAFGLPKQVDKMTSKYQTVATPNVMNIFLLGRQLERWNAAGGISTLGVEAQKKRQALRTIIDDIPQLLPFVGEEKDRSLSVMCVKGLPEVIEHCHAICKDAGIELGKGYGKLSEETFRLANFPAITMEDIEKLGTVLRGARF